MYKSIDYALQAVDKGYYVAPACVPRISEPGCYQHKNCDHPGKVPLYKHSEITKSADDVKRMWVKNYNILCKTKESRLVILDLDLKPDKPEGLEWVRRNQRDSKLNTRQHRTGSGGTHFVYKVSSDTVISHGNRVCRGLDLRGLNSNHYVIWIGSIHENGRFYEVIDDTEPEEIPQWLIDEISTTRARFNPHVYTEPGETILEHLWEAAGLSHFETDNRNGTTKIWVPCLLQDQHSGKKSNPFDCVLMSGAGIGKWGSYVCQHQSHKKITTQDAVRLLRKRIADDKYEEIIGRYRKPTNHSTYSIRTVDDCTREITSLFDIVDEKRGKIVIVQVSPGVGKTQEAIRYLGNHGHQPTNYFVPNHVLATEFGERLEAFTGIEAAHPRGVGNFKDDQGCVFPQMVAEAARLRLPIRQSVCVSCKHFKNYRDTGEKCKAGSSLSPMSGRHRILQHSTLDAVLRSANINGGNRTIIVDEQPELVTTQKLELSVFEEDETFELYGMEHRDVVRYRELANLIVNASRIFKGFATAKDVVSVGKNGANLVFEFNDKSAELIEWIANNELPYPFEAAEHLAKRITNGYSDAAHKMKRLADVFTMLYSLRTACTYSNRETFQFERGSVILRVPATWIVEATKYVQSGGTVLVMSASANVDVLKETLGDIAEFVKIHALDADGVIRSYRYDNRVSRKVLSPFGNVNQGAIRGALSRIYDDLAEYNGLSEILLITHKPVADALRDNPEEYLPISWLRQIESGGILHVAHYGAIVGLDMYKHCDAVITMGDPIMNIDVAQAESRSLGSRFESYLNAKTQGELLQSWGRLRACRRAAPCVILHVGLRKPDVVMSPEWNNWVLPEINQ